MKPKYKSKMRQKQLERARANRAESKESNKLKTTSAERMRKLRERRKTETSGVASEPGVASTSRAAQAIDLKTPSSLFFKTQRFGERIQSPKRCVLKNKQDGVFT
jgi:hypothetical protein